MPSNNDKIKIRIKHKKDSSLNWNSENPILLDGELGIESDTGRIKVGDGTTTWNKLKYLNSTRAEQDSEGNLIIDYYATKTELSGIYESLTSSLGSHTSNKNNPHGITKSQLGLDKVNNTADAEKEVKYATVAGSTTKAIQDGSGNVITETYATINDMSNISSSLTSTMSSHISNKSNPHGVTKAQLGLENVDNTADSAKSVKYADTAGSTTKAIQDGNGNVISETYATITDMSNVSSSLTSAISSHTENKSNPHGVTKAQLGLDKVDNTADSAKSVKYATSSGSATKATQDSAGNVITETYATITDISDISSSLTTTMSLHISNKSNPHGVTKTQIGLENVDNTADSEKSVKYATSSGSATKATQDAAGNIITETYATITDISDISSSLTETMSSHVSNKSNPHEVTKAQIGLENVDNTADANKSVKYATSAGSATKAEKDIDGNIIDETYATKTEVTNVSNSLNNTLSTHISNKSNPHAVTKAQIGLGKVDNTSDAEKEVKYAATAGSSASSGKDSEGNIITETYATKNEVTEASNAVTSIISTHTNNKSNPHAVTKAQVGLGNVDNTSDANKSVKYATSAGSATKATQDASGNNIANTYATKTELTEVLEEVNNHTHDINNETTGTLSASRGGTGQTSLRNSANSLLNALETGSSNPQDADYYIAQYAGGGTTTTTYHRRPVSALYNYIKNKTDNLYATNTTVTNAMEALRSEMTSISTLEILSSDSAWTGPSNSVYKFTKAVGTAKVIGVYKLISTGVYEAVCVDSIESTTAGNMIITSPDKFTGFALMSQATAFKSSDIDNVIEMVRELTIQNSSVISNIAITTSSWTAKTVNSSTVYTYSRSVGNAKVLAVYETISSGVEKVYPDKVIISSGGTLTIESCSAFNGYILLSSQQAFDSTAIDNVATLVNNKVAETLGTNVVKTVNGISPTNGAVTIPAVHEVNGIKFASSKWVENTSTGIYTLTLAAEGKTVLGCYKTVSGTSEWVIPDAIKMLSSGNVEIHSPSKFDGYVVFSTINWL